MRGLEIAYNSITTSSRSIVHKDKDEKGTTRGYDENGEVLLMKFDNDKNGIDEYSEMYAGEYKQAITYDNKTGKMLNLSMYKDEKLIDSITYKYNEKGLAIASERDDDGDGKVDDIKTYEYDENGLPVEKENDKMMFELNFDIFKR